MGDVDLERLAAAGPSRVARTVSAVFTPALTLLVTCAYVAGRHDTPARAALWWAITAVLVVGVPHVVLFRAIRAGRIDDRHVVRRTQRFGLMAVAVVGVGSALGLLVGLGAPRSYVALVVSMLAGLAVMIIGTRVGKPSLHVANAAGGVVIFAVEDPRLVWLAVLLIPVGWARVREGRHSVRQVLAGFVIGTVVTGLLYPLLR